MNTLKTVYIATIITGLFTGLFLSSSASAQDISGTWHGKLTVPTGSLTIVFHINQAAQGTYVTTLDSPDQGANGIKTQATSFSDSILTIQIPVIHASYKGKLKSDKTITGTFTQGMPIPLNLEKGEVISIIGPSGAGKSTLLRCLNHLELIQGGSICVGGEYLAQERDGKVVYADDVTARRILLRMGMVFQSFNLFPHMTVLDNILAAPVLSLIHI